MDHEHNADINDLLSEFRKQHDENSVAAHWAQVDALPRRVVQISAVNRGSLNNDILYALCSDGTVWQFWEGVWMSKDWTKLPPIPQEDDKPKADLTGGVGLAN